MQRWRSRKISLLDESRLGRDTSVTQVNLVNSQQDTGLAETGKESAMPMVGNKKYPYTAKGKAKAKAAAKKSGKKVKKVGKY